MKTLLITGLLLMAVGVLAVSTRPTDNECLSRCTYSMTGTGIVGQLVAATGASSYVLQVEDHLLYKTVTSRLDGSTVAYGIFGTVILQ